MIESGYLLRNEININYFIVVVQLRLFIVSSSKIHGISSHYSELKSILTNFGNENDKIVICFLHTMERFRNNKCNHLKKLSTIRSLKWVRIQKLFCGYKYPYIYRITECS